VGIIQCIQVPEEVRWNGLSLAAADTREQTELKTVSFFKYSCGRQEWFKWRTNITWLNYRIQSTTRQIFEQSRVYLLKTSSCLIYNYIVGYLRSMRYSFLKSCAYRVIKSKSRVEVVPSIKQDEVNAAMIIATTAVLTQPLKTIWLELFVRVGREITK